VTDVRVPSALATEKVSVVGGFRNELVVAEDEA